MPRESFLLLSLNGLVLNENEGTTWSRTLIFPFPFFAFHFPLILVLFACFAFFYFFYIFACVNFDSFLRGSVIFFCKKIYLRNNSDFEMQKRKCCITNATIQVMFNCDVYRIWTLCSSVLKLFIQNLFYLSFGKNWNSSETVAKF